MNKIYPSCFIDKDPRKHGHTFEGASVENPSSLSAFRQKEKPFVVVASMFKDEIAAELDELGFQKTIDYSFYPF